MCRAAIVTSRQDAVAVASVARPRSDRKAGKVERASTRCALSNQREAGPPKLGACATALCPGRSSCCVELHHASLAFDHPGF
jgi:hypothetical protein